MGIKVTVAIRDKVGKDFFTEQKKYIEKVGESDTRRLAERCESVIKYMIENTTDSGTGNLASHFNAEPILNGWGVGDIEELDSQAPYWNHIDKGSLAIGANWQHWLPKGQWVNGRWQVSDNGYFDIPQTPIAPHNYIAKTLAQMEIEIPKILKGK
jgi:hypothetical protein